MDRLARPGRSAGAIRVPRWVLVGSMQRGRAAATLDVDDLTPDAVIAFLAAVEQERHNCPATRNVRLAAIHAFFRFLGAQAPERLAHAQQILGIPFKRMAQRPLAYLDADELAAVLGAVDRTTRDGRRDYAMLATLFNTGARVQELLDLQVRDLHLTPPYQLRLVGKGRKERMVPLWSQTAALLRALCAERHLLAAADARVFMNQRGAPLTRFGVRFLLAKYVRRAAAVVPTLAHKAVHPHTLQHACAMHLLKAGIDLATIAQWLGHASLTTTSTYASLDLTMKCQVLTRAQPLGDVPDAGAWRGDATIIRCGGELPTAGGGGGAEGAARQTLIRMLPNGPSRPCRLPVQKATFLNERQQSTPGTAPGPSS